MGVKRWPVLVVALGVAGAAQSPDLAGADVTHDRVARSFSGGSARALFVQVPRATPLAGSPWAPCGRVRGPRAKLDEEPVTIDETDPWTGEAIPHERIAAPASRPLDNVDPWTGETIVVKGSALVQRETLDPYSAD
jgi:hypothetical protein